MFRYLCIVWLCLPTIALADIDKVNARDLFVREAFFLAEQGKYIDAISRMDSAIGQVGGLGDTKAKSLYFRIGDNQLTAGDIELSYRMLDRVKRGYDSAAQNNFAQTVRNEASSHLPRVYMLGGEPKKALALIPKIADSDAEISEEELYLRSQIYMSTSNYSEAENVLHQLTRSDVYWNFALYNLAIIQLQAGQELAGWEQLENLGKASSESEIELALIDKANLLMGTLKLEKKQPVIAKQYFNRVRLSGPYSNKALLGSGWADVEQNRYDHALVPWTALSKRDVSDQYVQESLLGVPYAYAKLRLPGRANLQYSNSIEAFDSEISRLDAAIQGVKDGKFLLNLFRIGAKSGRDWASNIRSLDEKPETHYLSELIVLNDIQLALDNYLDLDTLVRKIEFWERYLDKRFAKSGQSVRGSLAKASKDVQRLRVKMQKAKKRVYALLPQQRKIFETMVIDELTYRRKRTAELRVQAGLGMIENFEGVENQKNLLRGSE